MLFTFAGRAITPRAVRSINTSVVGFGPLTLLRPYVIVAGLAWGLARQPSLTVAGAAIVIAGMMIPFRIWLNLMLDKHGISVLQPKTVAE